MQRARVFGLGGVPYWRPVARHSNAGWRPQFRWSTAGPNPPKYPRQSRFEARPARRPGVNPQQDDPNRWTSIPSDATIKPTPQLSAAAREVQRKLAIDGQHPATVLRNAVADDKAPLDVIYICLEAYYKLVKDLEYEHRISSILKNPVTAIALAHIWQDAAAWMNLLLNHMQAVKLLAYFAVAENQHGFVFKWMQVEMPEEDLEGLKLEARERYVWRNILLRNIVGALLEHDTGRPADRALKIFFEFMDLRTTTLRRQPASERREAVYGGHIPGLPAWLTTSPYPAAVEMGKHICRGAHPGTDVYLYERFISFSERYAFKSAQDQRELHIARLWLHHPTQPSASLAISLLRRLFENRDRAHAMAFLPKADDARNVFYNTLKEAARVAFSTGLYEDAQWLDAKLVEIFGPPRQASRSYGKGSAPRN